VKGMQDYGQPGGAMPQQPPAAPPPKKKGKGLMIVGIILLIVGILIAFVGLMPTMSAKKAGDLSADDLEDGEEITITGEITEEGDYPLGGYMYVLDDEVPVISSEDIGNKGDTLTVTCDVETEEVAGVEIPMLKAKSVVNAMPLIIIGIILLIVGILLMVVGIVKRKKSAR
jgi:uncharacterized membrane protein